MGIWRLIESLDRHGVPASVLLNSDVCSRYPQIMQAGLDRNWAWLAHGRDNSTFQAGTAIHPGKPAKVLGAVEEDVVEADEGRILRLHLRADDLAPEPLL